MFLGAARQQFSRYPFVRFDTLDVDKSPSAQGFKPGSYDVVVAPNALHATRDVSQSLDHVRELLVPGGMLVLLEETERQRPLDLIFGLTDGWWRFQDTALRPAYPLLSAVTWQDLLRSRGFEQGTAIGAACDGTPFGPTVLLARAPTTRAPVAPRNTGLSSQIRWG